MGVIIFDFEQRITTINPSAKKFIVAGEESIGYKLEDIKSALAQEILKIKEGTSQTIRLNGAAVYQCSRLSFRDRGFAHPFILIEQMTDEVHRAEKNAY